MKHDGSALRTLADARAEEREEHKFFDICI